VHDGAIIVADVFANPDGSVVGWGNHAGDAGLDVGPGIELLLIAPFIVGRLFCFCCCLGRVGRPDNSPSLWISAWQIPGPIVLSIRTGAVYRRRIFAPAIAWTGQRAGRKKTPTRKCRLVSRRLCVAACTLIFYAAAGIH